MLGEAIVVLLSPYDIHWTTPNIVLLSDQESLDHLFYLSFVVLPETIPGIRSMGHKAHALQYIFQVVSQSDRCYEDLWFTNALEFQMGKKFF